MKKYILFLLLTVSFDAPKQDAYDGGWFKFRIHYGIVNAGYATLEVKAITNKKKSSMLWVRLYDRYVRFFFQSG
jgi:hypothetical protein